MLRIILIIVLLGAGIIFMGSILLMSPKGGLGLGIGGMTQSNEYGSKKSIESKLKKVALTCAVIFFIVAVALPYTSHE